MFCIYRPLWRGIGAGGGKSYAVLLEPLYHIQNPNFACVIIRKTYPEIRAPGSLWPTSFQIYKPLGAVPRENDLSWTFPSGAVIKFMHLQNGMKDAYRLQGSQIPLIIIDEATHIDRDSTLYLLSRNRTTCGIKPYMRLTCNPDAGSWLRKFIDWWIGPDGIPIEERSGVIRYFITLEGEFIWGDTEEELKDNYPECLPKSFTYIPAKLTDNKILMDKDPSYRANLQALHPTEKARLELGDWNAQYAQGKVFNRSWATIVDTIPDFNRCRQVISVRFYDNACTDSAKNDKAYYTAGCRMRLIMQFDRHDWEYYIDDFIYGQLGPVQGDDLIVNTATLDGHKVSIRIELEGGSAGPKNAENLRQRLAGYDFDAVKPLGNKLKRFIPFASDASLGKVKVLNAPWTMQYLSWLHAFDGSSVPGVADTADCTSGAHTFLSQFESSGLSWLNSV